MAGKICQQRSSSIAQTNKNQKTTIEDPMIEIIHELNNQLTAILVHAGFLSKQMQDTDLKLTCHKLMNSAESAAEIGKKLTQHFVGQQKV